MATEAIETSQASTARQMPMRTRSRSSAPVPQPMLRPRANVRPARKRWNHCSGQTPRSPEICSLM
jgi:hypothetical protein